MKLDKIVSRDFPDVRHDYTARDSILYALGVGFGAEPLDAAHLRYLFEEHPQFVAVPTMPNVLAYPGFYLRDPQYGANWQKLLHAEQRLEISKPLPGEGAVIGCTDIMGVRDKGADKGALLYQRKAIHDATTDELLSSVITTLMLRGDGGCGSYGEAPEDLAALPDRMPDRSVTIETQDALPLLYRLSGDLNPLHIDPEVAANAGFPRPILHGLCTKGLVSYGILRDYAGLAPDGLASIALRFTNPVLPGDRIVVEYWEEDGKRLRFRASVPERGKVVLDRGAAELR